MAEQRTLDDIREVRRVRLNELLERIPPAELARRIDLDPAYLYQMAKGKGRSRRGISDDTARKIERAAGIARGSLSTVDPGVRESSRPYGPTPNVRILRDALHIVECEVTKPGITVSAEGRAEITLAVYELLQDGESSDVAQRIVSRMLAAFADRPGGAAK